MAAINYFLYAYDYEEADIILICQYTDVLEGQKDLLLTTIISCFI